MTSLARNYRQQAQRRRVAPARIRWQPEHSLIAAVLQQAIWDRTQRTWYSTRRWINAMSEQPFGFAWCCQQIDQDPELVRAALLAPQPPPDPSKRKPHQFPHLHSGGAAAATLRPSYTRAQQSVSAAMPK